MSKKFLSVLLSICLVVTMSLPSLAFADTRSNVRLTSDCDHVWGPFVVTLEATCTSDGRSVSTCEKCGLEASRTVFSSGHDYVVKTMVTESTCISEGFAVMACTVCGKEINQIVDFADHTWGTGTVTQEPTCTTEGTGVHSCTVCGVSENYAIATSAHTWNEGTVTRVATCVREGETTYKCTVCKTSRVEKTGKNPDNHTSLYTVNAKAASCIAEGYTGDTKCSGCKAIVSSGSVVPVAGHNWTEWTTIPASCTSAGSESRSCKTCRATENNTIPAFGHTMVVTSQVEGTCAQRAATVSTCSTCGHQETVYGSVDSANHEGPISLINKVEGSCTADGYTGDVYCAGCKSIISYGQVVEATGHEWSGWTAIAGQATCTIAVSATRTCLNCGLEDSKEITDPGNHAHTKLVNSREATCVVSGYEGDTVCADCNVLIAEGVVIPAKGHSWDEGTVVQEATCGAAGEKRIACKECLASYTVEIPMLSEHQDVKTEGAAPATCGKNGYTGDTVCAACDTILSSGVVIPATGNHAWGEWELSGAAPSCTTDGLYVRACSGCVSVDTRVVKAPGHSWSDWTIDHLATCCSKGLAVRSCENCDTDDAFELAVNPEAHTGEKTVLGDTPATCTKQGKHGDTICADCKAVLSEGSVIEALGHSWGIWHVFASWSSTEAGEKIHYCDHCEEFEIEIVPAGSHNLNPNTGEEKKDQTLKVSKAARAVNYNSQLGKNVSNPITAVYGAKGAVSYKVVKAVDAAGNVVTSRFNYVDDNQLRVKAGTDHGDYKVTVRVSSAETDAYEAAYIDVVVTISVKMTAPTLTITKTARVSENSALADEVLANPIVKVLGAKGEITYQAVNCVNATTNKVVAVSKYFSVNTTTGQVTVKAGTPKGVYKLGIKVTSGATYNYKSNYKTVGVRITVK